MVSVSTKTGSATKRMIVTTAVTSGIAHTHVGKIISDALREVVFQLHGSVTSIRIAQMGRMRQLNVLIVSSAK